MRQSWHDLLFAHWAVDADKLRSKVPGALELETFGGRAWIGVVPFRMSNVALRGLPPVPWLSSFPELNVRTYVRVDGKPGVYFFSLDAARALAVAGARLLNLPYFRAAMSMDLDQDGIQYRSRRRNDGKAGLDCSYVPVGEPFVASPGSLVHFLIERYCLYDVDRRERPFRMDIHHPRWTLRDARASFPVNSMAAASGIALPVHAPLLHFARRQDVVVWSRERLTS